MSRRTLTALTLLSAAALLSTTACSSHGDTGSQKQQPVRTAEPSPKKGTPGADSNESATERVLGNRAPDPVAERVVLRQNRTRNSAHLEFGKARKGEGKALTVAVSCEGKGTIEVLLRPMAASFPMDCLDGEVTSIDNQFAIDGAESAGTVSVTASSKVRWSLSIGRGEPAEQDLSD
ncbi:hypothetical protein [Streptomyces europaeiscabiei]|uniref:hypothetical protein n=1 Tax=Streptomyces europaeiscabiei TaxID=146819 RepID=UPI002E2D026B|nr:hypothetical protein [Streptomyces europaeiscabiei]